MEYIRCLDAIHQDDVTIAGGKGANLGALVQAGFPVPAGFVVLTSAYQSFVERNGLQREIERLAKQVSLDEPSSFEQASDALRALFAQASMPDEIKQAILAGYEQLRNTAVAVRSSATAEDLPGASFAGQQETYLNITTPEGVLKAVQTCWASLWTARALDYRTRRGITADAVSLAVVVQEMVQATAAGILFTANPVNGKRDEIVINAAWGLGEAIVSGQVSPDTIIVEKASGAVKQVVIGNKTVMTVPVENGTAERAVDDTKRQEAVLTHEQIRQLTRPGRDIEQHFQMPQDIEWAIADEQIFILQARPITTLATVQSGIRRQEEYAVPGDDSWDRENEPVPQPFDLWSRTNLGENFPFPITPLSETIWPALFITGKLPEKGAQTEPAPSAIGKRLYGRLYINEGAVIHMYEQFGLPTAFSDAVWGSSERGLRKSDEHFHVLRLLRRLPPAIVQGVRQARQSRKKQAQQGQQKQPKKRTPRMTNEQIFAQVDRWVADFMQQNLSKLDDRALWEEGVPVWGERAKMFYIKVIIAALLAGTGYYFLQRRINKWTKGKEDAAKLVTALSGVYTAELGPALWQLAKTLRDTGLDTLVREHTAGEALALLHPLPEAQPFLEQFAIFLKDYGYRCPNDAEFLNPRWMDAPEQVITMLAGYLQADEPVNPLEMIRHQRQEREDATVRIEQRLNFARRVIFRRLLKMTQSNVRRRDNNRSYLTKFLYPMRTIVAELGRRWCERGWLNRPEDVFFLTVADIDTIITSDNPLALDKELHSIVDERRAAFDFWYTIEAPDAVGADGTPIAVQPVDGTFLQGIPASSGRVRGTARIIRSIAETARLTQGDILVTQATDPGWTPIFPLVSGIVLEIGGQLSHGAIIAREYAIPAVINAQGALHNIRDGQTIIVDGTLGRVYMEN